MVAVTTTSLPAILASARAILRCAAVSLAESPAFLNQVNHLAVGATTQLGVITSGRALLKRQIIGIHHWVSPKHLDRYVQEMTWRFNRRDMKVTARMNDLFNGIEGHLNLQGADRMNPHGKKLEPKLGLDMPFSELISPR